MEIPVHHAETGETFLLLFSSGSAGVEELKRQASEYTSIPLNKMIMLNGSPPYNRIDSKRRVASILEPVFVYNRATFTAQLQRKKNSSSLGSTPSPALSNMAASTGSTTAMMTMADGFDGEDPCLRPTVVTNAGSPLEQQHQLSPPPAIQKFLGASSLRLETCESVVGRCQIQLRAACVAVGNLSQHSAATSASFRHFTEAFEAERVSFQAILDTLDSDLEVLSSMPLARRRRHPPTSSSSASTTGPSASGSPPRLTLRDVVPVEKVQIWQKELKRQQSLIAAKASEVEIAMRSVEAGTAQEESAVRAEDISMNETIRAHFETVKTLEAHISALLTEGSAPEAAATAKALELEGESIATCRKLLVDSRAQISRTLVGHLTSVSRLESKIEEVSNKIAALKQGLSVQTTLLAQIEFVKHLPKAYAACVMEADRRRAFDTRYLATVDRFANTIAEIRREEMERRAAFARGPARFVPPDLVPGLLALNDQFPPCEVTQRQLDPILFANVMEFEGGSGAASTTTATMKTKSTEEVEESEGAGERTEEGEIILERSMKRKGTGGTTSLENDAPTISSDVVNEQEVFKEALGEGTGDGDDSDERKKLERKDEEIRALQRRVAELEAKLERASRTPDTLVVTGGGDDGENVKGQEENDGTVALADGSDDQ